MKSKSTLTVIKTTRNNDAYKLTGDMMLQVSPKTSRKKINGFYLTRGDLGRTLRTANAVAPTTVPVFVSGFASRTEFNVEFLNGRITRIGCKFFNAAEGKKLYNWALVR